MLTLGKYLSTSSIRPETVARFTVPVNFLFVVLLAWGLARLTWSVLPAPTLPHSTVAKLGAEEATPAAAIQNTDYDTIASWHLFGRADVTKTPPSPSPAPEKAPETPLDLKLVGVFYAEGNATALAIIAEGKGEEHSYTLGKEVAGKAKLIKVLPDKVILSRNGRQETLSLPKTADSGATSPAQSLLPPLDLSTASTPKPVAGKTINASAIAKLYRDKVLTEPQALQELAFATPYVQNGQFKGFRLRPGRNRRLLRQLGLRSGDVVTQLNGVPLESPDQGLGMLQQLLSSAQVTVHVLRNGTEIPFTFVMDAQ